METAYFVLRVAIGTIALWASFSKLGHFRAFTESIRMLRFTPPGLSATVAAAVIATELAIAGSLLADVAVAVGSTLAVGAFGTFAGAAVLAMSRRRSAPCHCFGDTEGDIGSITTIARAGALLTASVALLLSALTLGRPDLPANVPASITIGLGMVLLVRYSSLAPRAVRYLRAAPPTSVPATRRQSFRHRPIGASLHIPTNSIPRRSALSMVEPRVLAGKADE